MEKLKLGPSYLKGSPLTEEEMKSILGGMQLTRVCSCYYVYSSEASGLGYPLEERVEASNEFVCESKCRDNCNSNGYCISRTFKYSVG